MTVTNGEVTREVPVMPGGQRVLGQALKFGRDPLALLQQAREHGDVVRIRFGPISNCATRRRPSSSRVPRRRGTPSPGPAICWPSTRGFRNNSRRRPTSCWTAPMPTMRP